MAEQPKIVTRADQLTLVGRKIILLMIKAHAAAMNIEPTPEDLALPDTLAPLLVQVKALSMVSKHGPGVEAGDRKVIFIMLQEEIGANAGLDEMQAATTAKVILDYLFDPANIEVKQKLITLFSIVRKLCVGIQ